MRWTADGYWGRGVRDLELPIAVEMMAQAAVAEAPEDQQGKSGFLAGIQGAELKHPVPPGTVLAATTRLVGKLGPLVKVEAALATLEGEEVARADLLLSIDA